MRKINGFVWDGLILFLFSAIFIAMTWGKWTHPIIDFGRELYIPWRMNHGELLYKDLASLFGPFPHLWNAFIFLIFGASIQTLLCVDVLVIGLYVFLIYRFFNATFNRLTALLTTAAFLVLFVFNYLYIFSNMYYLSPYSHSYFYALLFALMVFNTWQVFLLKERRRYCLWIGFLLGLTLLSRLEIFLAAGFAIGIGLMLDALAKKLPLQKVIGRFIWITIGLSAAVLPVWIYVASYLSLWPAWLAVSGYNAHWREVASLYLYKNMAGFIDWESNSTLMAMMIFAYGLLYGLFHLCGQGIGLWNKSRLRPWLILGGATCVTGYLYYGYAVSGELAFQVFRGVAIFPIILGILLWKDFQNALKDQDRTRALAMFVFCIFALLLTLKVPLRLILGEYGLIYGMPAVLVSIAFWVDVLPRHMPMQASMGRISRVLIIALLVVLGARVLLTSLSWLSQRNKHIGQGSNSMNVLDQPLPFGSGTDIEHFLQWQKVHLKPEDTFVVLPEGVMLNFLTGHQIAGRHVTFMAAEMETYGEDNMLKDLQKSPPDYFILVKKDTSGYGGLVLGKNYAKKITGWILEHYRHVWRSGGLAPRSFNINVFKRNEP